MDAWCRHVVIWKMESGAWSREFGSAQSVWEVQIGDRGNGETGRCRESGWNVIGGFGREGRGQC